MLDISKLQAGRIYSFRQFGQVEFVGKRDGIVAPAWLSSCTVTRQAAFRGNACNKDTYSKLATREDPNWESSRAPWYVWTDRTSVVRHAKNGNEYLAIVNPQPLSSAYFVDGKPATEEQITEIRQFKKSKSGAFGLFATFNLDKVECQGEV